MHIITKTRILEFIKRYPDCRTSLNTWYTIISKTNFNTFEELRKIFPSADQVEKFTVFNIGGNKARLIAAIHYNRKKVYIRHIFTHVEYDKNNWRRD